MQLAVAVPAEGSLGRTLIPHTSFGRRKLQLDSFQGTWPPQGCSRSGSAPPKRSTSARRSACRCSSVWRSWSTRRARPADLVIKRSLDDLEGGLDVFRRGLHGLAGPEHGPHRPAPAPAQGKLDASVLASVRAATSPDVHHSSSVEVEPGVFRDIPGERRSEGEAYVFSYKPGPEGARPERGRWVPAGAWCPPGPTGGRPPPPRQSRVVCQGAAQRWRRLACAGCLTAAPRLPPRAAGQAPAPHVEDFRLAPHVDMGPGRSGSLALLPGPSDPAPWPL